mgnify:CR=1 FL=1|tara:strand:- start:1524 stop:2114 length:591 start_codon:yes stop_codon:yes gene_type:complete
MSSWGTAHASATNKPKYLTAEEKKGCYADNKGWTVAAGGNDNANADREVLVAIGGLAGTSATTGLREATVTSYRFIVGTTANTDLTANDANAEVQVEITWDEAVTVTGTPQVVIANNNASGGGYGNLTLSYTATGSTANSKRFIKTSAGIGNTDVLTLGGTNVSLNGGTLKDTASGTVNSSVVLTGLSAVAVTVSS